jgi:hypothetical protein
MSTKESSSIPTVGERTKLADSVKKLLETKPTSELHLGGEEAYSSERRRHTEVLGWHNLSDNARALAPIHDVEFTAIRTKHGRLATPLFCYYL